jgi:sensor histidine kinase YesM
MQIHPHFLFNTLNSIASLLHTDIEAADKMIARLSDFLRLTLNSPNDSVVTLEEEMVFLETYLAIEKTRFGNRLTIETDVDPDALPAKVPNLILQPLIENAVRHGVARKTGAGYLHITAKQNNGRLMIRIEDNGPGLVQSSKTRSNGNGVGLANTRARLSQFYEGDFEFEISEKTGSSGTVVDLNVPFLP